MNRRDFIATATAAIVAPSLAPARVGEGIMIDGVKTQRVLLVGQLQPEDNGLRHVDTVTEYWYR